MKISKIRGLVNEKRYAISKHAFAEAFADGFNINDILTAINGGEIIEQYEARNRCLIYAKLKERSVHIVIAFSDPGYLWIITVYIRSQNTMDFSPRMNAKANTYFRGLLAHVNLKENTKAFQASEVYEPNSHEWVEGKVRIKNE